jgi:hypothetical protein
MLSAVRSATPDLVEKHYLGPARLAQFAWKDEFGVAAFANPRARHLPQQWLELVRWCLRGQPNDGSRQWVRIAVALRRYTNATTVVSYSDPGQGHTGSLYRACGWLWAPTWHRLNPPPSGNGAWSTDKPQSVKDRWVYPLRPDAERAAKLTNDIPERFAWARFREPTWRADRFDACTGGGDFKRFKGGAA